MAAVDLRTYNNVNHWRKYRDPTSIPLTLEEFQTYYRIDSFGTRPLGPPRPFPVPPRIIPFGGAPQPIPIRYKTSEDPIEQAFLNQNNVPGIPISGAFWKGIEFLGTGTFGHVGLWEWQGPADRKPKFDKVVVKQMRDDTVGDSLGKEAGFYDMLNKVKTSHIVRMLHEPQRVSPGGDGLGVVWTGIARKLFLEYCPNGTVWDLWTKHNSEQTPFTELTLWLIFECMIDAISVLEYGAGFREDEDGELLMNLPADWNEIVHFDFHPGHIFIGGRDRAHTSTPMLKLGDFGYSEYIDSTDRSPGALQRNAGFRGRGVPGYLAPEQFTDRYDYTDWTTSGIASVFGPWTMIFSAACILYQLATLSPNPPSPSTPFLPPFYLNNAQPLGYTYGIDLQAYTYSIALKDLIFECLYEMPSHRPDLLDIKTRIKDGVQACLDAGGVSDAWDQFVRDEPTDRFPVGPGVVPPPPSGPAYVAAAMPAMAAPLFVLPPPVLLPGREVLIRCTRLTRAGTVCKNQLKIRLPLPREFDCGRHRG